MGKRAMFVAVSALALALSAAPVEAALRITERTRIGAPPLPEACGLGLAESTPQIAVVPGHPRRLVALFLVDGGNATAAARSRDGGRTWRSQAVPHTTFCDGGPESRGFVVNPRLAVGAGGTAFHGASFAGMDGPLFDYGVQLYSQSHGGAWTPGPEPAGEAQDLAVLPLGGAEALITWSSFAQVPNPATYLPAGTILRGGTASGGSLAGETVVHDPGAGNLTDDPKLLRMSDGSVVALVSTASYGDLVSSTLGGDVRFAGVAVRSTDGGATWSPAVDAGEPVLFTYSDPDTGLDYLAGLSDAAAGRHGRALLAWAEPPSEGAGSVAISTTRDAGVSWSEPRDALRVPTLVFGPQVAIGGGRTAFFYYGGPDRPGDGKLMVRPWLAVKGPHGSLLRIRLGRAFDMAPMLTPPGYSVDGNALGVTQDVVALGRGRFGVTFTVPAGGRPRSGFTDVVYAEVTAKAP